MFVSLKWQFSEDDYKNFKSELKKSIKNNVCPNEHINDIHDKFCSTCGLQLPKNNNSMIFQILERMKFYIKETEDEYYIFHPFEEINLFLDIEMIKETLEQSFSNYEDEIINDELLSTIFELLCNYGGGSRSSLVENICLVENFWQETET